MIFATTTCTYGKPMMITSGVLVPVTSGSDKNFQFATSSCNTVQDNISVTIASSTATNTPMYINGFSYGEIVTGFFLLFIATSIFFGGVLNRVIGVKQKSVHKQKI